MRRTKLRRDVSQQNLRGLISKGDPATHGCWTTVYTQGREPTDGERQFVDFR